MNTLMPPAAAKSAPRPSARTRASRTVTAFAFALALPLVAACSSDDGGSPSPTDAVTTSTEPAPSESSFATPTVEANGDPFCDLAVDAQAKALELEATAEQGADVMTNTLSGTGTIGDVNAWGATLHQLASDSIGVYDDAVPYVEGTEAEASFAEMRGFVEGYSLELARIARDAPSTETFLSEVEVMFTAPETQAAIETGPVAAQEVAAYISERCPADG